MKMPFPGMDPYLEHPALWPGVHTRLSAGIPLAGRGRPALHCMIHVHAWGGAGFFFVDVASWRNTSMNAVVAQERVRSRR